MRCFATFVSSVSGFFQLGLRCFLALVHSVSFGFLVSWTLARLDSGATSTDQRRRCPDSLLGRGSSCSLPYTSTLFGFCGVLLPYMALVHSVFVGFLALRLWLCRILALKSPDSRGLDQGPVFSLSSVLWLQWLLVPCSGFVGIWCLVTLSRWLLAPFSLYVLWLQWLLVLSMNSCRSQDLPGKSSIGALQS